MRAWQGTPPRRRVASTALCLISALALGACATPHDSEPTESPTPEPPPTVTVVETSVVTTTAVPTVAYVPGQRRPVLADVRSDAEKAASLLTVGVVDFDDAVAKLNAGVGGIFVTGWADPAILSEPGRDLWALRHIVKRPFEISIDFEGGRVNRHPDVFGRFPSAREMADTKNLDEVRVMARDIGLRLASRGVTVNFAPVVDVEAGRTDIVGDRAYSDDPRRAADYAVAFARGLADAHIAPVYKHFPGHGTASGDTHEGGAHTVPLPELAERDLAAFATALDQVPGAAMMGHMVVPGLGKEGLPASLNPAAYRMLRTGKYPGGKPFSGVVYTDDLSGMKAISDMMSTEDAAVAAIAAGADQVLWSDNVPVEAVVKKILAGLKNGTISRARFEDAVRASAAGPNGG